MDSPVQEAYPAANVCPGDMISGDLSGTKCKPQIFQMSLGVFVLQVAAAEAEAPATSVSTGVSSGDKQKQVQSEAKGVPRERAEYALQV